MKSLLCFVLLFGAINQLIAQNIGIGTRMPHPSAMVDMTGLSQGLLVPRMTAAEKTAFNQPAKGLLVFDSTSNEFKYYTGTSWLEMQYAGTTRFGYTLQQNLTISASYNIPFVSNYNLDTANVTLTNSTTITISKPGLYRFGLLGFRHNESAPSATANSATIELSLRLNGKQYRVVPTDVQKGATGSWSYVGTSTILFDLYVPANSAITLGVVSSNGTGFFKSDTGHFFGYHISD
jgi:hypothetical protein